MPDSPPAGKIVHENACLSEDVRIRDPAAARVREAADPFRRLAEMTREFDPKWHTGTAGVASGMSYLAAKAPAGSQTYTAENLGLSK